MVGLPIHRGLNHGKDEGEDKVWGAQRTNQAVSDYDSIPEVVRRQERSESFLTTEHILISGSLNIKNTN